jgi:hypothetical protein
MTEIAGRRSFADVVPGRGGCPRCGWKGRNAGNVLIQLRRLGEGPNSTHRQVSARAKSLCESCSVEVFDSLVAYLDEQVA